MSTNKENIVRKLALELNKAFAENCNSEADKIALLREIFDAAGLSKLVISISGNYKLPILEKQIVPSELWKGKNAANRENPAEFIERIYKPHFESQITWSEIRKADQKLYFAFAQWIRRNPHDPMGIKLNKIILDRSAASHVKLAAKLKEQNVTLGW